ncbi:MAG: MgtC/SapB family protein [Armatimonadetes bacterium]|nr:MgtC/SapB family protein [Armatimonadota bacterium]
MGATTVLLTEGEVLWRLAVALGIGLFIGLEREYSRGPDHHPRAAGIRTHALVGLLGAVVALLASLTSMAVLPLTLAVLALLVVASYLVTWQHHQEAEGQAGGHSGVGMTSEVVILLTFVLGALVYHGRLREAVVTAGAASLILSAKAPLHGFVAALSTADWVATMKFAVITLVILPVLPNQGYGPYEAFNPFKIWLMVVLIGGISFLGYVLTKVIGANRGIPLTGLIGGLASSTAVTLANARRSKAEPELSPPLALATVLACVVMLPRLLLIVAALHPPLVAVLAPPFAAMLVLPLAYGLALYRRGQRREGQQAVHANPFELHSALKFAAVFAVVTFLVKWVQASGGGQQGLYLVSFLAGLVETDAIVVAMAQQAQAVTTPLAEAARAIVLAAIANSLLKGVMAAALGSWRMAKHVLAALVLSVVAGGLAIWLTA